MTAAAASPLCALRAARAQGPPSDPGAADPARGGSSAAALTGPERHRELTHRYTPRHRTLAQITRSLRVRVRSTAEGTKPTLLPLREVPAPLHFKAISTNLRRLFPTQPGIQQSTPSPTSLHSHPSQGAVYVSVCGGGAGESELQIY